MRTPNIIFLLLVSSVLSKAQTPNPFDFYPYHTGDVRQYRSQFTGDLIGTEYTDSVVVNPITKNVMIYNRGGDTKRIDSLGNVYNMNSQSDYILYKLYANSGDTWISGHVNDTIPVTVTITSVYGTVILGVPTTVKVFRFEVQNPAPIGPFWIGNNHLAEGFGRVQSDIEPSDVYLLTGAIINEVKYGTIVSVNEPLSAIPQQIVLYQNYPNPFNPTTVIRYLLPVAGHVSLRIYDVLGREVATLAEGEKDSGYYTATFDGSRFSSGVYFIRLAVQPQEGKQSVQVKKMLMIK